MTALLLAASAVGCDTKSDDDEVRAGPPLTPPTASGGTPSGRPDAPNTASGGSTHGRSSNTGGVTGGNPEGTYFAEVHANGTGCPAGTWETEISPDKRSFTMTFDSYEAKVDDGAMVSIKDCQLALNIKSHKPVAYAVETFAIAGYAQLERGVNARLMAGYYFQGSPIEQATERLELPGDYDREYEFAQDIALPKQVWSQCGLERELNVTTRVRLLAESSGKKGHVNVAKATGKPKVFIQLSERPCP